MDLIKTNRILIISLLIFVSSFSPGTVNGQTDTLFFRVYFNYDESILPESEKQRLLSFLDTISPDSLTEISIEAFCDDRGSAEYNDSLAKDRATSVFRFIHARYKDKGWNVLYIGMGELPLPGSDNDSIGSWRKVNRRAEIRLVLEKPLPEEPEPIDPPPPGLMDAKAGDTLVFQNILFVGGHHKLLPESYPILDELYRMLTVRPDVRIKILGHVCCTYDPDGVDLATNRPELSVNRARTVYEFLIDQGIDSCRLEYEGLGSRYKLGRGAKYDRRVEIEVLE